jgi:enamidase
LIDIGRFAALRRVRLWYDPGRRHCAEIEERRMKTAIVNIGQIVSGDWKSPFQSGDAILCEDGLIQSVGTLSAQDVVSADVVIDAGGATAIPGLIDSHVHITFGDYTPRQKTVGYLESYLHGGVTTAISASEVHVPGRPKDPIGVKALAVAASRCFKTYRPGGMRVHAGSVILEPGLNESDFAELRDQGVWLAKAGFGAFATPFDYAEQVAWAKQAGMITTMHTGGSSIPGSSGIWADHLLAVQPHVSFHVNGGPVAMPDKDFPRLVDESEIALQICTAGNLRTTLLVANLARKANAFHRLLIATDTPTGSGIMPLGLLYTISHLASLTDLAPELAIAAATGNNAEVYKLNSGFLRNGRDADIVLIDACAGGSQDDALSALRNGDVAAVGAVVTAGIPRFVGRSRNTPATIRRIRVAECRLPMDFSGADH